MRALAAGLLTAAMLGGCTTARNADSTPGPAPVADTISFSASACFGACPVYSVTVEPDGSAVLYPQKYTSVPGETRFTVTPLQYRKLRDSLAPFRPATGGEKRIEPGKACLRMATDMPGYTIRWTRKGRKDTQLYYYGGCHDAQYTRLRAAIVTIPRTIDIEKMLNAGQ